MAGAISSGTLEALLGTPTQLVDAAGRHGRICVHLDRRPRRRRSVTFASFDGRASAVVAGAAARLAILLLIIVAHLAFGLFSAALILAFRTPGPLPSA